MLDMRVGELVRRHRKQMVLTQEEFGALIAFSPSYISRIENGEYAPTKAFIQKLIDVVSLSQAEIALIQDAMSEDVITDWQIRLAAVDLGTCPNVVRFYGRIHELDLIKAWVDNPKINIVGILGMGGLGKSYLAAQFANKHHDQFDAVVCRTLATPYPAIELVHDLIDALSDKPIQPSSYIGRAVLQLHDILNSKRCLLILDNFESVLNPQDVSEVAEAFAGYRTLLQGIGNSSHQSCILLTSRYRPQMFMIQKGKESQLRTITLEGLDEQAIVNLLKNKELSVALSEAQTLHTTFSGNPLLLEFVGDLVQTTFQGNLHLFLEESPFVYAEVEEVLEENLTFLSPTARLVMLWLAVERRPLTIQQINAQISPENGVRDIAMAIRTLINRSLLDTTPSGFKLQNYVQGYLISSLVQTVVNEMRIGALDSLCRFPLLNTAAPEYVQAAQRREILQPIVTELALLLGSETAVHQFLYRKLRQPDGVSERTRSICCGNLLNLLIASGGLTGSTDLSRLALSHVDFRETNLQNSSLAYSHLQQCVFHDAFGHVLNVAFSPNGRYFAAATASGNVHIWDSETYEKRHLLQVDNNWVRSIAWHPTKMQLITCSSGQTKPLIQLWDINTNRCLKTWEGHSTRIRSVAFTPDGRQIVTGSEDKTAQLWRVSDGELLHSLSEHSGAIWAVAVSPDGTQIATAATDNLICLWELESGKLLRRLEGHRNWVTAVSFHPKLPLLASGSKDQTARLWDTTSGKEMAAFTDHGDWVRDIAFWPERDLLVTGGGDKTVRLWDIETQTLTRAFTAHDTLIETIAVSPDQRHLLTGGSDQTIRLWESNGHCLHKLRGYKNPIWGANFSADGRELVTGSSDGMVRLWQTETGDLLDERSPHDDWAKMTLLHPTQPAIISGSSDKTICILNRQTGEQEFLEGHTSWISDLALHPNGRFLASSSGDHTLRVWDLETLTQHTLLPDHAGRIWAVRFSPNGRFLACGDDEDEVVVWDWERETRLHTFSEPKGSVYGLSFSPDGTQLYAGGADSTIYIWDVQSGELQQTIEAPASVWSISFQPDGNLFATAHADNNVRLYSKTSHELVTTLEGHKHPAWFCAFSPDGQTLASCGDDQTVRLWSMADFQCRTVLRVKRPYEALTIQNIRGLNAAQIKTLKTLGAVTP